MSEIIYFKELYQINRDELINDAPAWARNMGIRPLHYDGFNYGGHVYNFGAFAALLSDGSVIIQTHDQIMALVKSVPALQAAGMLEKPAELDAFGKLVAALKDGKTLSFVTPDQQHDGHFADIKVLSRTPVRDALTDTVDTNKTWVIISAEYASGLVISAVRLSVAIERFKEAGVAYRVNPRGIDPM